MEEKGVATILKSDTEFSAWFFWWSEFSACTMISTASDI